MDDNVSKEHEKRIKMSAWCEEEELVSVFDRYCEKEKSNEGIWMCCEEVSTSEDFCAVL